MLYVTSSAFYIDFHRKVWENIRYIKQPKRLQREVAERNYRKERCESGLIGTPGERVWPKGHRGFESRPLRKIF